MSEEEVVKDYPKRVADKSKKNGSGYENVK
jgi:hypothetical protein